MSNMNSLRCEFHGGDKSACFKYSGTSCCCPHAPRHIQVIDLRGFEGSIYFTTDIHGCFDLLSEGLSRVGFDHRKDKLIMGGDTSDRGAQSCDAVWWIEQPWIHSILGNHEQMFIEAYNAGWDRASLEAHHFFDNGGDWVIPLLQSQQYNKLDSIYKSFSNLPLAIKLITDDEVIGVVHAQCPYDDWDDFEDMTNAELEWNGKATATWARTNYRNKEAKTIKGVDRLLVGHTVTDSGDIEVHGNTWYCDVGVPFQGVVKLLKIR